MKRGFLQSWLLLQLQLPSSSPMCFAGGRKQERVCDFIFRIISFVLYISLLFAMSVTKGVLLVFRFHLLFTQLVDAIEHNSLSFFNQIQYGIT